MGAVDGEPPRRSVTTLANGFLVAFCADGVWSLAAGLAARWGEAAPLPALGPLLALASGLLALAVFLALGLAPRLPKRVLLPPCLFVAWSAAAGMPLPLYLGLADGALALAALQSLAGAAALGLVRHRREGQGWLLADVDLPPGVSRGRNALSFFGATLILGPPVAALYLGGCLALATAHFTGGFVAVGLGGVTAQERVYARGDQAVHLVAMVHVADAAFYRDVLAAAPAEGTVVLLEGVTDEQGLLRSFSYGRLAKTLGLDAQEESLVPPPNLTYEHADVDVGTFAPATVAVLVAAGRLLGSESPGEAAAVYGELATAAARPGVLEDVRHDLIDGRNAHLMARLGTALETYRTVVVPWGAAHLPGIEEGLLGQGFRLTDTRERRAIRFGPGVRTTRPYQ